MRVKRVLNLSAIEIEERILESLKTFISLLGGNPERLRHLKQTKHFYYITIYDQKYCFIFDHAYDSIFMIPVNTGEDVFAQEKWVEIPLETIEDIGALFKRKPIVIIPKMESEVE